MDRRVLERVCISDRRATPDGDLAAGVLRAVATRGATLVILRELDLAPDAQAAWIRRLRPKLPPGVPLLLARDAAGAAAAGADGVQLGFGSVSAEEARRLLEPGALVGRSVHTPEEAAEAGLEGADFVLFGPVKSTPKPRPVAPVGFDALRAACEASRIPVVAVGGLTEVDAPAV
ncbi:MAG TPA: thiamine phosphate synthase, partial [Planctomycetota bacterium]|nr:thiamine phosphate synthase [Planctomycetota bacterium]